MALPFDCPAITSAADARPFYDQRTSITDAMAAFQAFAESYTECIPTDYAPCSGTTGAGVRYTYSPAASGPSPWHERWDLDASDAGLEWSTFSLGLDETVGVGPDGVHPSLYSRGGGVLDEHGLECGFNVRNFVTLRMLKIVRDAGIAP